MKVFQLPLKLQIMTLLSHNYKRNDPIALIFKYIVVLVISFVVNIKML